MPSESKPVNIVRKQVYPLQPKQELASNTTAKYRFF